MAALIICFLLLVQRKRKLDTQSGFPCKKLFPEDKTANCTQTASSSTTMSNRNKNKHHLQTSVMQQAISTQTETYSITHAADKQKQCRSVIPTKDNPPPGMIEWLAEFQVFTIFILVK